MNIQNLGGIEILKPKELQKYVLTLKNDDQ